MGSRCRPIWRINRCLTHFSLFRLSIINSVPNLIFENIVNAVLFASSFSTGIQRSWDSFPIFGSFPNLPRFPYTSPHHFVAYTQSIFTMRLCCLRGLILTTIASPEWTYQWTARSRTHPWLSSWIMNYTVDAAHLVIVYERISTARLWKLNNDPKTLIHIYCISFFCNVISIRLLRLWINVQDPFDLIP